MTRPRTLSKTESFNIQRHKDTDREVKVPVIKQDMDSSLTKRSQRNPILKNNPVSPLKVQGMYDMIFYRFETKYITNTTKIISIIVVDWDLIYNTWSITNLGVLVEYCYPYDSKMENVYSFDPKNKNKK